MLPTHSFFFLLSLSLTALASPPPAGPLQPRQTPLVLPGTCTVSTNFCLVTWPYEPPTQSNYTCGRHITLLGQTTDPAKACPLDGHVRSFFVSTPLLIPSLLWPPTLNYFLCSLPFQRQGLEMGRRYLLT